MKIVLAKLTVVSLVLTTCLAILSPTLAAGESWLRLSANTFDVEMDQEFTIDVLVENAPEVYGADVQLGFDPAVLQVVDADNRTDGVQLSAGSFFDPAQSFFLQNMVDNSTGTMHLAMTLLNPAPPVQGDGLLCQITFRVIAAGRTTISIRDGLFGTRTGETIAPRFEDGEPTVSNSTNAVGVPDSTQLQTARTSSAANSQTGSEAANIVGISIDVWRIMGIVALLATGVAIGLFLSRRRAQRTDS